MQRWLKRRPNRNAAVWLTKAFQRGGVQSKVVTVEIQIRIEMSSRVISTTEGSIPCLDVSCRLNRARKSRAWANVDFVQCLAKRNLARHSQEENQNRGQAKVTDSPPIVPSKTSAEVEKIVVSASCHLNLRAQTKCPFLPTPRAVALKQCEDRSLR